MKASVLGETLKLLGLIIISIYKTLAGGLKITYCLLFKKRIPSINEIYKYSEGEILWAAPVAIVFIIFLTVLAQFNVI